MRFEAKESVSPLSNLQDSTVQETNYGYLAHQCSNAKSLAELSPDATFKKLRTLRHKLAWLSLTIPNLFSAAEISLQVTMDGFKFKHVGAMNNLVRYIT